MMRQLMHFSHDLEGGTYMRHAHSERQFLHDYALSNP
jgi:hypothetical protein